MITALQQGGGDSAGKLKNFTRCTGSNSKSTVERALDCEICINKRQITSTRIRRKSAKLPAV